MRFSYLNTPRVVFFKRHRDGDKRYKTLIIQLSHESDYQGGELIVGEQSISKTQGTVIMFDANTYHQLNEVISGKRHVFVVWLLIEHFRMDKNIV